MNLKSSDEVEARHDVGMSKFSIEKWQPSADAAEFNIKPDASGETYKTTNHAQWK